MSRFLGTVALAAASVSAVFDKNSTTIDKADVIPGEYIVVLKSGTELTVMNEHSDALVQAGAFIVETYDISSEFRGYTFKANSTAAEDVNRVALAAVQLEARNDVAFVEQDRFMHAQAPVLKKACDVETDATWGISRLTAKETGTTEYYYESSRGQGEGVTAYIIDSGVRQDHDEFTGRIATSEIFDGYPEGKLGDDSNGHGTHVAGTVAGTVYGVAKLAKIAPVKVLSSSGTGSNSVVIAGVQHACNTNRKSSPPIKKRVANMSLGGGYSNALNKAVKACVDKGMLFVVAAGNDYADSCDASPAAEDFALTVMASDKNDEFSFFSNFGDCSNIIAPGSDITSAWIGGPTSKTNTISGTSMASPHVCGAAAVVISGNPTYTVTEVRKALLDSASDDVITNVPKGSINQLLHIDLTCTI